MTPLDPDIVASANDLAARGVTTNADVRRDGEVFLAAYRDVVARIDEQARWMAKLEAAIKAIPDQSALMQRVTDLEATVTALKKKVK